MKLRFTYAIVGPTTGAAKSIQIPIYVTERASIQAVGALMRVIPALDASEFDRDHLASIIHEGTETHSIIEELITSGLISE